MPPTQGIGLLVAVGMAVVDGFYALLDMPHHALTDIGPDAGARQQRTRGPSQIMQLPLRHVRQLGVESAFSLAVTVDMAIATTGQDVGIVAETRLRANDVERHLGQH
jgi:hypothetical protein